MQYNIVICEKQKKEKINKSKCRKRKQSYNCENFIC